MRSHAEGAPQASVETDLPQNETYLTRDWNENVLHIYPRTFNEERPEGEEHRGIGSILGITKKLDWMVESGITAIWLGPIYASPGLDGNYDISDYYEINPELGTLDDVRELINEAHERDIRVIFDLVPNHTSDQSEWFKASSDPNHPDHEKYKDYYIWHDPIDGKLPEGITGDDRLKNLPKGKTVPNNWPSIFSLPQIDKVREKHGGEIPEGAKIPAVTAWVWNEARQQFYLAEFMKNQPSLNWSNSVVRDEIKKVVRFWLNLGIDSFRVDVMNHIGKDPEFRDEEPAVEGTAIGEYNPGVTNPHDQVEQEKHVSYWPTLRAYTEDLLSVLNEDKYQHRNIRFIFEDWRSALNGDDRLNNLNPGKANVFNFETLLNMVRERWTAKNISRIVQKYYERMNKLEGAVPNQVTGNHDTDTLRTRLGSAARARAAYLMLAALPGALYIWQGDMLGRPNAIVPKHLQRDGDIGKRDGERIPMQWDSSKNGGFSNAEPEALWLPTVDKKVYQRDNLEIQARDPNSPYRLVKETLKRRMSDIALRKGGVQILRTDNPNVFAFARNDPENPKRRVISLTNFSQDTTSVSILDGRQSSGKITLSSSRGRQRGDEVIDLNKPIVLPPDESYWIDSAA